jgi:hypothetical protein
MLLYRGKSMARTTRIRKNAAGGTGLFTGLIIILVLACSAHTGNSNNNNPQLEEKSSESEIKRTGQTGILQPEDKQQPYVLNEVLVKFKPGTDADTIAQILEALNLKTIRNFSIPNLFLMKITDGSPVKSVIKKLETYEAVKYAEPNYVVKATQ